MPKVITQEHFDEVVKENMELDLSLEEAAADAVEQFQAQGVDLSNIITDPNMSSEAEKSISDSVNQLKKFIAKDTTETDVVLQELTNIRTWCDKGTPFRVLAGNKNVYRTLIQLLDSVRDNTSLHISTLNTLTSLMKGYPDLLDNDGVGEITQCLTERSSQNSELLVAALAWIKECCLLHEINRQKIIGANASESVSALLRKPDNPPKVIIALCDIIKSLTLDDDIRETISKAHDHARLLANENLCILLELLSARKSDLEVVPYILNAVSSLTVRNEYCEKVDDAGGITHILDIMTNYPDVEKLNSSCMRLIKVLAGNDDVKAHLVAAGVAPILISAMSRHQKSVSISSIGCACIAALALRNPNNCEVLVENGAADVIVTAMKIHKKVGSVEMQACLAIRNVVSRSRHLKDSFLALGVEDLLNEVDKKTCGDEAKAALRDLECKVKLEEPFKGKGVKLGR